MTGFALRVTRDQLEAGQSYARPLSPANRVLYVLNGDVTARAAGREAHVPQNGAWHATAECRVTAAPPAPPSCATSSWAPARRRRRPRARACSSSTRSRSIRRSRT